MLTDPNIIKAFVLVQGNRLIRDQIALDFAPFEAALGTGLRAGSATSLWFAPEQYRRLPFESWLEELRTEGLRDIDLIPAVPGLTPTLLALELGPHGHRLYRDQWERTAVTLPSARALLEFVRRHPGEGLEERAAHYARELGLAEKESWEDVKVSCAPEKDELWLQAVQLAVSHVEVSEETATDWEALLEQRPSSKRTAPALVFTIVAGDEAERVATMTSEPRRTASVAEAGAALEAALQANLSVAQSGGWTTWVEWFTDALDRLHVPPAPDDPWVQLTAGCDIRSEVLSLARAADKSHVFGGMGSWNDVPCDNQAERERLWQAMHDAWGAVFAALKVCATGG